MSFECHLVSIGSSPWQGLGEKEAKTNILRMLGCMNMSKPFHFEEHPPAERRWAKLYVTRTFPACSPVQLMFTEYLESSSEWHKQNPHNIRPELNLLLMKYLTTNLQIIKKKIISKHTTFFFRNTDSSVSSVKDGPSSTDTAFCQHWAGVCIQRGNLIILTTICNLTGSYTSLIGEVFRAGEG